jgi:diaminohydroxyphosphoribosylaminopyrimidine deaminase/5-amino-6-(5-phosphoribosylamino)uracil reductase
VATATETDAMRRAVALSARALGHTAPNPVVGCVILDAYGAPAGEGWHQWAGGPHAEVNALLAAGRRARGGTALVTLEPCNHTGRTGPCARALIGAGLARVVYAVADPGPIAAGGAATLRAAGVDVESGLLAAEAETVNIAWLTSVRRGRPFVRWKYAATLDGRIAAADGSSRWISSAESRADVHRLRAEADAVIVGAGTLRADDPHLAVRGIDGVTQPLRVIVDSRARITAGARVLDDAAPTLIAVGEDADTAHLRGVGIIRLPYEKRQKHTEHTEHTESTEDDESDKDGVNGVTGANGAGLDVSALLAELHARGVRSVLLEGGPTLAGAFVAAGVVDAVTAYLAPVLLGAGPAALADAGITTLVNALRLDVTDVARLGRDLRVTAVPTAPQES